MITNLVYNAVTCLGCGEKLVSRHRHDYVQCSCENGTFIDGGLDYRRYGGKNLDLISHEHVNDGDTHEKIREVFARGSYGKEGDEPLHYILLKDMTDEHVQGTIDYELAYRPRNPYLNIYRNEIKFRKEWKIKL